MPEISFVIPSYNCAVWLPHAVESARRQTENDIEIIIVNDGSDDSTSDYLAWLRTAERRAKIIEWSVGGGRCAARNAGNAAATSDIIAVLDADDIAYPNRAKDTIKKMKNCDFVYGSADSMGILGQKYGTLRADVFDRKRALETQENRIVHSTCAYRKSVSEMFPYSADPQVSVLGIDDWEFQIRCALGGVAMDYIPQTVAGYRIRESGVSSTRNPVEVAEKKKEILCGLLTKV